MSLSKHRLQSSSAKRHLVAELDCCPNPKIKKTKTAVTKIQLSEPVYEGRLKVISLLPISSHDSKPTFDLK